MKAIMPFAIALAVLCVSAVAALFVGSLNLFGREDETR